MGFTSHKYLHYTTSYSVVTCSVLGQMLFSVYSFYQFRTLKLWLGEVIGNVGHIAAMKFQRHLIASAYSERREQKTYDDYVTVMVGFKNFSWSLYVASFIGGGGGGTHLPSEHTQWQYVWKQKNYPFVWKCLSLLIHVLSVRGVQTAECICVFHRRH